MRGEQLDLIGQEFFCLTVLSYAGRKDGKPMWHCRCSCGKEKDIIQYQLTHGIVKSCGHLKTDHSTRNIPKVFTCQICGAEIENKTRCAKRKYCPECAQMVQHKQSAEYSKAKRARIKKAAEEATHPRRVKTDKPLSGYTLSEITAMARAQGLSYGVFSAQVESGLIKLDTGLMKVDESDGQG